MKNIFLLGLIFASLAIAGCVSQTSENQPGLYEPPEGNPALAIISPTDGEVI